VIQETAEHMRYYFIKPVSLVNNQMFMKRQKTEIRKKIVEKDVMVDDYNILPVEGPEMSIIKTFTIKRALARVAVIGITADPVPEFRGKRQFIAVTVFCD
jgi:hypothetical protein